MLFSYPTRPRHPSHIVMLDLNPSSPNGTCSQSSLNTTSVWIFVVPYSSASRPLHLRPSRHLHGKGLSFPGTSSVSDSDDRGIDNDCSESRDPSISSSNSN